MLQKHGNESKAPIPTKGNCKKEIWRLEENKTKVQSRTLERDIPIRNINLLQIKWEASGKTNKMCS